MSAPNLLPCPFCGGQPELVDDRLVFFVRCKGCKPVATVRYGNSYRHIDHIGGEAETQAAINAIDWTAAQQSAVDSWNTRAPAEDVRAMADEAVAWAPESALELLAEVGWIHVFKSPGNGGAAVPLYRHAPRRTMQSVMQALCDVPGMPMLTSNQCAALADRLNNS